MKDRTFRLLFILTFALAIIIRIHALFNSGGIIHSDELYQYIEQAHRLTFGYGMIPWEFMDGVRSWFYPLIIHYIFQAAILLGFTRIEDMVFFTRTFSAVLSILLIYVIYLIGRDFYNWQVGLASAFFATFSPLLVLYSARIIGNVPSLLFSTLTLYLLYIGINSRDQKKILFSGISLGVSFMFHFSAAIFLLPLILYTLFRKFGLTHFFFGFFIVILFQGFLDMVTWGSFIHSPISFFMFTILENKSALFGTGSAFFYIIPLLLHLPLLFLIPFAIERKKSSVYLSLIFCLYLSVLLLIPHKEIRFFLPILPPFLILSARGLEKFYRYAESKLDNYILKIIMAGLIISIIIISPINNLIYDDDVWAPLSNNLLAMRYVGLQNDSTGVAYTMHWYYSGVYTYLHKNIPALYLTTNETLCQGINKNPRKYHYYIPQDFQCHDPDSILKNEDVNYIVVSYNESLDINPILYQSNFTKIRSFGDVGIFRK